jgi:hypothetical protein
MTLLNVLERQVSAPANYRSGISSGISELFTTKLLQDMVEVAAEGGHVGLVGANGGGSDIPLVLPGPGSMAGRTEPGPGTAEVVTGST